MRKAVRLICAAVSLGCFIYTAAWLVDGRSHSETDRLLAEDFHHYRQPETAAAQPPSGGGEPERGRFAGLADVNPEIAGWIKIEGTAIDYPVVRGEDNDRYIRVDFYGESSKHGAIFMDYRCGDDSRVKIIYGHHMKDGTMFRDLYRYENQAYRDEHPVVIFYPPSGGEEKYQVVDVLYWDATTFHEQTFFGHINAMDDGAGTLLALATCDNNAADARLAVIARGI